MYKLKILNIFFKILFLTVFTSVFSTIIICFILAKSILITDTDSYEETFYEEINPELQISFQDYLKSEVKNENEILDKGILFVNENSSYDINGSVTDLASEKFVEIL